MAGLPLSPGMIVLAMMLVLFVIGTMMDTTSMLLLTVPIFVAIAKPLGVDLVWFGIMVIVQMELSAITPPVGLYLFALAGLTRQHGITLGMLYKGVLPFCITCFVFCMILLAFPGITMVLVEAMRR